MKEIAFNIRADRQPNGGFSVVIAFEPQRTEDECCKKAAWIAEQLQRGLGWDLNKV